MSRVRCPSCGLDVPACACTLAPRLGTRLGVVIVRHHLEAGKPSNTARLASLLFGSCRILSHGAPAGDAPLPADLDPLRTALLYPGDGDGDGDVRPPALDTLLVLDGTWPQTRRMLQRRADVRAFPRLSLRAPAVRARRLRRAPREGSVTTAAMSTLEALAAALDLLEGGSDGHAIRGFLGEVVRRFELPAHRPPRHEDPG